MAKWVKSNDEREILEYPVNLDTVREENPNIPSSEIFTEEFLNSQNYFLVTAVYEEFTPETHMIVPTEAPTWNSENNRFEHIYEVVQKPSGDVSFKNRITRNEKLRLYDFYALTDSPEMPENIRIYRQALRDLPIHENWPYLEDNDWPQP